MPTAKKPTRYCASCHRHKPTREYAGPATSCKVCAKKRADEDAAKAARIAARDAAAKASAQAAQERALRKFCNLCKTHKLKTEFGAQPGKHDGLRSSCKSCVAQRQSEREQVLQRRQDEKDQAIIAEAEARAARLASDWTPLAPEDFSNDDVSVANDAKHDRNATRDKRQDYSKSMGEYAQGLQAAADAQAHGKGSIAENMPGSSGTYIAKVAEQERRFHNRRLARSISLTQANEALSLALFRDAAEKYLRDKVKPTGYAAKSHLGKKAKRTVCLFLSDLHLGAELSSLDEPIPFRALEESRRLEYLLRQALDYKPQYRDQSELLLILNGDMIEGQLGHDLRSGAPLTEQKVVFWRYFRQLVGLAAQQYPNVRVVCQPGNHGRDIARHPGRATSSKWDSHEWELYYGLKEMCSGLTNVTWQIDFRAVSIVDLHGANVGVTHGDTEVKLGHPDKAAAANKAELHKINASRLWGVEFVAWLVGHWHTARYHPGTPRVLYNGMLVPPNGHARAMGYISEPCGQWLFESVEGFPIGDLRFIEVGTAQDRDDKLGSLIQPFRFVA